MMCCADDAEEPIRAAWSEDGVAGIHAVMQTDDGPSETSEVI